MDIIDSYFGEKNCIKLWVQIKNSVINFYTVDGKNKTFCESYEFVNNYEFAVHRIDIDYDEEFIFFSFWHVGYQTYCFNKKLNGEKFHNILYEIIVRIPIRSKKITVMHCVRPYASYCVHFPENKIISWNDNRLLNMDLLPKHPRYIVFEEIYDFYITYLCCLKKSFGNIDYFVFGRRILKYINFHSLFDVETYFDLAYWGLN